MGVLHGPVPQAFSDVSKEMARFPRQVVGAIRLFRQMLEANYDFVVAAASQDHEGSITVLKRVGFEQYAKPTKDHRGLFVWRKQHSPS